MRRTMPGAAIRRCDGDHKMTLWPRRTRIPPADFVGSLRRRAALSALDAAPIQGIQSCRDRMCWRGVSIAVCV